MYVLSKSWVNTVLVWFLNPCRVWLQRGQSICHMTGGDRTEQPVPERRILKTKMDRSYLLSCYNKRQGVKMILGISSTRVWRCTNHLTSLSFCQSDWKIGLKELGATVKVNSASGLNFTGSIFFFPKWAWLSPA